MKNKLLIISLLLISVALIYVGGCGLKQGTTDEPTVFKLSFYLDGELFCEQNVLSGNRATEPITENYDGYKLDGWFTDTDMKTKWNFNEPVGGNMNLYARFVAYEDIICNVAYVSDGEIINSVQLPYGAYAENISPTAPTGYEFCGWYFEGTAYDFSLPLKEDLTLNAVFSAIEYEINFYADDCLIAKETYTVEDRNIEIPEVPEKPYYNGEWSDFQLDFGDLDVFARYTAIPYTAVFIVDGEVYAETDYTVEDTDIPLPAIPEKTGYTARWDKELTGGNLTVNAIYEAIDYVLVFRADGNELQRLNYCVTDTDFTLPPVPELDGYTGKWHIDYTEGNTVYFFVYYTLCTYTATFIADEVVIKVCNFTVDSGIGELPEVPDKEGYSGAWEDFTLSSEDIIINAVYTPLFRADLFTYKLSGDGTFYSITGYTGNETDIIIPPEYNGIPVREIAENAFFNSDITSVQVLNGITAIGDYAFQLCTSLACVSLPDSLISIGANAFEWCAFSVITLPDNLSSIGDYSFTDCRSLTEIYIPKSLSTISDYSFYRCTSLKTIVISDGVEAIGKGVFSKCYALTQVNLGSTLKTIGEKAFYTDGNSSIYNMTIPSSVTYIGEEAFSGTALTSVIFENPNGWKITVDNSDFVFSKDDLENGETAAKYLTNYYKAFSWTCEQTDTASTFNTYAIAVMRYGVIVCKNKSDTLLIIVNL